MSLLFNTLVPSSGSFITFLYKAKVLGLNSTRIAKSNIVLSIMVEQIYLIQWKNGILRKSSNHKNIHINILSGECSIYFIISIAPFDKALHNNLKTIEKTKIYTVEIKHINTTINLKWINKNLWNKITSIYIRDLNIKRAEIDESWVTPGTDCGGWCLVDHSTCLMRLRILGYRSPWIS